MSTSTSGSITTRRHPSVLHRWPSALGLAGAVLVLIGSPDGETLAIIVSIAALCYLAAAAMGRPWVAWPGIVAGSLLVDASESLGLAWWVGIAIAAVALVVLGLLTGASRPVLAAQTAALAGFGGLALAALLLAPPVGLVLVATVLASHALWDLSHYRRNRVVTRSLAEFCIVLDVVIALWFIALAVYG